MSYLLFFGACTVRVPHSLVPNNRPLTGPQQLGARVRAEQCYSDFLGIPVEDVDMSIDAAMTQLEGLAPAASGFVDIRVDMTHGWSFWPLSAKHCTRVSARPSFASVEEPTPAPVRPRPAKEPSAPSAGSAKKPASEATHAVAREQPACVRIPDASEGPLQGRTPPRGPVLRPGVMARVVRHEERDSKWFTLVETLDSATVWVDSSCLEFR